ncbi:PRC-barrel domain-containing protein [Tranquillimonas alkanivorans]|uniref:PRC-barrel domain-containing protein n=1 Tax=Tranquillimonas alkanivorans TaxID=441119 RepID=A0A1I5SMV7_9RHOB|nr:PRC-barrel domain-containing protein [Tranquillimonas alkanivorans]SFP72048.1 PRC-barrel domain-containing protein [Tranquillimonas alkanivorans]
MFDIKAKLLGSAAALALLTTPGLAQEAFDWESTFNDATEMQMSEASGSPLLSAEGDELGQIEYFGLMDDEFYVVILDPEGREIPVPMTEVSFENDQFIADVATDDIAMMEEADTTSMQRIADEATIEMAFLEVERRGALASGQEASTQTVQTASGQFIVEQADPQVDVDVPDPQVSVQQNAPEVTVEQPEPTITVTQSKPNVMVEQQAPTVTVEQAQPTVTVDIPEPVVTIRMPEPDVNVATQQPDVQVQQPEPVVRFVRPEPRIVIEEAEAEVQVSEAEAQVDVTTAEQAQVAIDQGEPQVDMQTAGEADVAIEQAEAEVNVEPAEGAQVAVEQSEAEVNLVEEQETAQATAEQPEVAVAVADIEPRVGFVVIDPIDLSPTDLTGVGVYGEDDERVGEVSELVVGDSGNIEQAIVDVGGFLGLGEKSVAMDLDQMSVQRSETGDMMRVYVTATEEELEDMPAVQ